LEVNADVHDINVISVEELDDSNRLGMKAWAEIGIVGVAAAIANAAYHATKNDRVPAQTESIKRAVLPPPHGLGFPLNCVS
jgi:CO/xanthine dehydrogenase Mo-binding subunit